MVSQSNNKSAEDAEITKQRLIKDLKTIGVNEGDHLGVGLSLKNIGYVKGGPEAFIDALIETVGPEGTIMMNTHTEFFYPAEVRYNWIDYVFDPELTKVNTGIVPELFRQRKNSVRSRHPTFSVAASGKYEKYLTEKHDENASAYFPYSRLADINGKYLAIGIGDRLVGLRHQAQFLAGLLKVVPWIRVVKYKNKDGEIHTFILRDRGGCVRKLPELVTHLRREGLGTDGYIGMAKAVLVPAKESLEVMTDLLKVNPEINLCDQASCLWCRELERRLNLYKKIKNPRYFQKNSVVIYLLALMNCFREIDNRLVVKIKLSIKKHTLN